MNSGSDHLTAWLIGIAAVGFVVILLALFNKHISAALGERWDILVDPIHILLNSVLLALGAAFWMDMGREALFWASSVFAAVQFVRGVYFFLHRNKPADDSPAAKQRRAALGVLWSLAWMFPLAWMIAQTAAGAKFEGEWWAVTVTVALMSAIGVFDAIWKWRPRDTRES